MLLYAKPIKTSIFLKNTRVRYKNIMTKSTKIGLKIVVDLMPIFFDQFGQCKSTKLDKNSLSKKITSLPCQLP